MNFNGWCPILSRSDEYQTKCTQSDCAWYDGNRCIVFSINSKLEQIVSNTSDISSNDCSSDVGSILGSIREIERSMKEK